MENPIRKDAPRDANHGATNTSGDYTKSRTRIREYLDAQLALPAESQDEETREFFAKVKKSLDQYLIERGIAHDLAKRSPRELAKKNHRELSRRAQSFALIVRRLRRGEPAIPTEWGFDHNLVADKLEELHDLYQQASQAALQSLRSIDALNANTKPTNRRSV